MGTSVANLGNTLLVTEKEYGDYVLELDVKIDSPLSSSGGQTRSYFYSAEQPGKVYGRQVEIDPSARNWSGGIHDEARRQWLYPLDLHPQAKTAFKVGECNHLKVECLGHEMKTWVNSVPVAYIVDPVTPRGFIGPQVPAVGEGGQAGQKVYFKNIRIKTTDLKPSAFLADVYVANFVLNTLTAYEKEHGWKLLFEGKTSQGWRSARAPVLPSTCLLSLS